MVATISGAERGAPGGGSSPRLFGVLITFRRPEALAYHLGVLAEQERRLDHLIVVDNAADAATQGLLASVPDAAANHEYLPLPDNGGPAGGIAHGLRRVLEIASDTDWVVLLDDDNPPRVPTLFDSLLSFGLAQRATRPDVAGVGVTGARLDRRKGSLVRFTDDELHGTLDVDYIGGNQFATLNVGALRRIGVFDEELFFGFDDLEFGLRVGRAGMRLVIDAEVARWARARFGRLGANPRDARVAQAGQPWRRYYSLRNLLYILVANGYRRAALRVTLRAGIGKFVATSAREPRSVVTNARLTVRALHDGWTRRLGRTIEPGTTTAALPLRRPRHAMPRPVSVQPR